jgi:hypothetical protein
MAINNLARENIVGALTNKSSNPQEIETKTSNYTLAFPDKDKLISFNSSSTRTLTIPADTTTNFLLGTKIDVTTINQTVTLVAASGVSLNGTPTTVSQYQTITIVKTAANTWTVRGGAGGGATGGGTDKIFVENNQTITENYTITENSNAVSTGPLEALDGVIIEVPIGSVWHVV